MDNLPLIAIVGPTAVGKSSLALHLAGTFGGEVVSVDSRQVYRSMDIGTCKPTPEQRARVPHHLVDCISPDEEFSLAIFRKMAETAVVDIHGRGLVPILAGGTGQYLWGFLEGWEAPHIKADEDLRRNLESIASTEGPEVLHNMLKQLDPESAEKIDYRNVRRVVRALEIYHATGVTATELRSRQPGRYNCRVLGLDTSREDLYRRIDDRVDEMFAMGLVAEVEALLGAGYSPKLSSMSGIGYREVISHLEGKISLEEAALQVKYNTHRLARHQYAWFRRNDPRITWLTVGDDLESRATEVLRGFLQQEDTSVLE